MILIKNGIIYPMCSPPIMEGAVLIHKNKILQVYSDLNELPDFNDSEVQILDAKGGLILPGLIESHCHIGITEDKKGISGRDSNETVDPITPTLLAIDAVNPMDSAFTDAIQAGITSVMTGPGSSNVVGGQFILMKTFGRVIDDMVVKSPAAMKVAFGENPKICYQEMKMSPVSRMAISSLLREELFQAVEYRRKKEYYDKEGKYFERSLRYESWLPVLEKKLPLKAHVHRACDIMSAIRIAKEFDLELTLDHCTEGYLIPEKLKRAGYPAIVGPNLNFKNKLELENMKFENASILYRAGIPIAITTDHPVSLIQTLPICAGLAVKAGLPMEEGLRAITINAAEICGAGDRLGSIQPGFDADIAIFDGNPMNTLTKTLYTIIDGKIIYDYQANGNERNELCKS